MYCFKCGHEINENAAFCQNCGVVLNNASQIKQTESPTLANETNNAVNPTIGIVLKIFKDKLFLVICILVSSSTGISLINFSFPIINILYTIFLWIIFAKSQKAVVDNNYIRYVSGTIFASYIIKIVIFSIVGIFGIFLAIFSGILFNSDMWNEILSQIKEYTYSYAWLFNYITSAYIMIISVVLIFFSLSGILLNIFGWRSIHKFVQSIYKNIENKNSPIANYNRAQIWLLVFGIIKAVSIIVGNVTAGCNAAALIIGSILIKKYFVDCK
jgi:hypothetical protein